MLIHVHLGICQDVINENIASYILHILYFTHFISYIFHEQKVPEQLKSKEENVKQKKEQKT